MPALTTRPSVTSKITEVLRTPSSTQSGFELMTSRSWQYIPCHWVACSKHSVIRDFTFQCLHSEILWIKGIFIFCSFIGSWWMLSSKILSSCPYIKILSKFNPFDNDTSPPPPPPPPFPSPSQCNISQNFYNIISCKCKWPVIKCLLQSLMDFVGTKSFPLTADTHPLLLCLWQGTDKMIQIQPLQRH